MDVFRIGASFEGPCTNKLFIFSRNRLVGYLCLRMVLVVARVCKDNMKILLQAVLVPVALLVIAGW